ncbi:MAG: NADP-dependent oxidoreductase [Myxococcota bacterium]
MRAATLMRYGFEGVSMREDAAPTASPGQLVIRTHVSSLNPVDVETVRGKNKMLLPLRPPFVPGVDLAGLVGSVGAGVSDFEVGDRVVAYTGVPTAGAFAELVSVPASGVAKLPAEVPFAQAAALCLSGLAGKEALAALALPSQSRILVHGAAGSVGRVATQLALAAGHAVVANVHSRDRERMLDCGVSQVLCYDEEPFDQAGLEVGGVIDTVGGATFKRSFGVVRPGGAIASLRATPEPGVLEAAGFALPWLMRPVLRLLSSPPSRKGVRIVPVVTKPDGRGLTEIMKLAAAGKLSARVGETVPLERVGDALERLSSGALRGKCVVQVA